MGKKEKLTSRLMSKPKDFEFNEAKSLLELYGYNMTSSGKTSGSRVSFIRGKKVFRMHKPHPRKELLTYQIKELIDELKQEGLI
ncbi:MAG: type II toxin-antitoxin system HicA family toxin [Oscillospiraceae bacterium]|nr:type II toxin-antitoxin system HicA family toxin [Oscillospiraceae bacterium]